MADFNFYFAIAVNGFFTGIGTGAGVIITQYYFNKYIEPRLNKGHKLIKRIIKPKRK